MTFPLLPATIAPRRRWRHSKQARRLYVSCILALSAYAAATALISVPATARTAPSRQLLSSAVEVIPGFSGAECSDDWENDSGGVVWVIAAVYAFLGIAIICDGYFTDALDAICSKRGLDLSNDVAGATFMAAGSSAPELASSFMGVFIAASDVGLGTILGSAVFNILVIIGATAIIVGKPLQLDWRPLVRDNVFYVGSVILLIAFVAPDEEISWVESMIFLIYYGGYIVFMYFNEDVMDWVDKKINHNDDAPAHRERKVSTGGGAGWTGHNRPERNRSAPASRPNSRRTSLISTDDDSLPDSPASLPGEASLPKMGTGCGIAVAPETSEPVDKKQDLEAQGVGTPRGRDDPAGEEGDEEGEVGPCGPAVDKVMYILSLPFEKAFEYTIPDCRYEEPDPEALDDLRDEIANQDDPVLKESAQAELNALENPEFTWQQRWYPLTFVVSLVWITILSFFMVEFMLKLGCLWSISDEVMGLTFLAMGTSIPDALGSVAVARDGEGDMAVSNAIGSNVFDICFGLGLPYLIKTLVDGDSLTIKADDIHISVFILLGVVIVLFATLYLSKNQDEGPDFGKAFCLKPWTGYVLFVAYFCFVVYTLVYEAVK